MNVATLIALRNLQLRMCAGNEKFVAMKGCNGLGEARRQAGQYNLSLGAAKNSGGAFISFLLNGVTRRR